MQAGQLGEGFLRGPQPLLTPPWQPHPQRLARLPASQGASMVGSPRAEPFVELSSDPTAVPGSG